MKRIPLSQDKFAIVDDEDYERINQFKWCAGKFGCAYYAVRHAHMADAVKTRRTIFMHRVILNIHKGLETDHINHNGLDNRKQNLRACTRSQNSCNILPQTGCTSKYKGVCRHHNKWQVQLHQHGKAVYVGRYDSEIEAAKAYDMKAIELFGNFAYCNFEEPTP